jgi:hypothetical protein
MEHIVKRGISGGILGGVFGLLITATWAPLLGVEGPGLQMALPMTAGFALFLSEILTGVAFVFPLWQFGCSSQ